MNLTVDIEAGMISFGVNEIMYEPKKFYIQKFRKIHLAIWLQNKGDEVLLFSE